MISTRTKRKFAIVSVEITKLERFKPIEIRLPSNVRSITGALTTASSKGTQPLQEGRLGLVRFQSNDKADVFHVEEVWEAGVERSDENILDVEDPQFESEAAWITGRVPKFNSLGIEGDSILLRAWFKGENFDKPFLLSVYVEYEEAEELMNADSDDARQSEATTQSIIL